jgi:chitinase
MPKHLNYLLLLPLALAAQSLHTVPTFTNSFTAAGKQFQNTFAGRSPEADGTTTIASVLVPLSLTFESSHQTVSPTANHIASILHSPLFQPFAFPNGNTQYADAVQRAQFPAAAKSWHTLLGTPHVEAPMQIQIPAANGYLLHSQRTGSSLAIVDLDFVREAMFKKLGSTEATPDKLLIAVAENTAFYSLADATVCCSVGTHGAQPNASGTSAQAFVIGSFYEDNVLPHYLDIQGLSQQVAEWMSDPLHGVRTNEVPAWLEPPANLSCGGTGASSDYLLEQPTDFLPQPATRVSSNSVNYHLENIALLPWFMGATATGTTYSFPDTNALTAPAKPCSSHRNGATQVSAVPRVLTNSNHRHALIGYWEGYESAKTSTTLRDISPQWDIIIATFAAPVKGSSSQLRFAPPSGYSEQQFASDVAFLKSKGKKVLISLGGGGQVVTLSTASDVKQFVASVSAIVEKYGFDGIDLDIETPSLLINPGDTDFRHPTTPSVVNLIAAVHQLRNHFGPKFMLSEVPEAAQTQAGMQAYGGQFGCFLPVMYGTRDILSFVDAQDYNTPPLEALDGNYYFPGHADYHVALTEMLLLGFPVSGDARQFFPPIPPDKVAIGLPATPTSARNYTDVPDVADALRYLIEGKLYPGAHYRLRRSSGYPDFLGAMYWAINEDRANNYKMSNAIGPLLHQ